MLYAGVEDVRLLDGGYAAWTRLQFPLERGQAVRLPAAFDFGSHYPRHPEYLVDAQQVRALVGQPDACVASIRTWNEFIGKTSGYSYIPAGSVSRSQSMISAMVTVAWLICRACPPM
jgi:thiosulfate/3-mercaptopyruvate sulfurtransferase